MVLSKIKYCTNTHFFLCTTIDQVMVLKVCFYCTAFLEALFFDKHLSIVNVQFVEHIIRYNLKVKVLKNVIATIVIKKRKCLQILNTF